MDSEFVSEFFHVGDKGARCKSVGYAGKAADAPAAAGLPDSRKCDRNAFFWEVYTLLGMLGQLRACRTAESVHKIAFFQKCTHSRGCSRS